MLNSQKKSINHAKLIINCAKNLRSSLMTLYKFEAPSMMALAYRALGHAKYSEQAIHKTFVSIWDNAASYTPDLGSARGWIYSILRFHINELFQKHYNELALSQAKLEPFVAEPISAIIAQLDDDASLINNCQVFEQLSQEQQDCIINKYFSPDSQAAAATRLGLPLARFSENIHTGLAHIVKQLSLFPKHNETVLIGEYALGALSKNDNDKVLDILSSDRDATVILLAWENFFIQFIKQLPNAEVNSRLAKDIGDHIKDKQNKALRAALNKTGSASDNAYPGDSEDRASTAEQRETKPGLGLKLRYYLQNVHVWQAIAGLCVLLTIGAWAYSGSTHTTDQAIAVLVQQDGRQKAGWSLRQLSNGSIEVEPLMQLSSVPGSSYVLWVENDDGSYERITNLNLSAASTIAPEAGQNVRLNQLLVITLESTDAAAKQPQGAPLYAGRIIPLNYQQ